jgi:hypothetical protein
MKQVVHIQGGQAPQTTPAAAASRLQLGITDKPEVPYTPFTRP